MFIIVENNKLRYVFIIGNKKEIQLFVNGKKSFVIKFIVVVIFEEIVLNFLEDINGVYDS